MYKNLLLVCLLQAVFARRIPLSFSSGQFYVRNLGIEDYELRTRGPLYRNVGVTRGGHDGGSEKSDSDHTGLRVDHNSNSPIVSHIDSGHRAQYQMQLRKESTEARHDDSGLQNPNHDRRRSFRDNQNKDRIMNNSQISKETQNSLIDNNQPIPGDHKLVNRHGESELKTNLDEKTNVSNINTSVGMQYEGRNIESDQRTQGARTNVEQGDHTRKNSIATDQSFLNTDDRLPNKTRKDRLSEAHTNNDMIIFKDEDNTGAYEFKSTTDIAVKYNNKTDGLEKIGNEKDKESSSTTTSLPSKGSTESSDDGLGDRTALDGDKCPDNQVKVRGVCMTPD